MATFLSRQGHSLHTFTAVCCCTQRSSGAHEPHAKVHQPMHAARRWMSTRIVGTCERMFNKRPDVRHLRTFGSVCYPLVQKQFRDPYQHSKVCDVGMFVGYCQESGCYKVYLPKKKIVVNRRDCWFDENWQTRQLTGDVVAIGIHASCILR